MKFKILIKVFLIKFFMVFPQLISDEEHSKLLFRVMFGYTPDLEHPKTMNEYICSTKVSDEKLRYDKYTDKYEVRDYVRKTIGDQYLNEVIGVYNRFNEIDFDQLPDAFAMKATHGSYIISLFLISQNWTKMLQRKNLIAGLERTFITKIGRKTIKTLNLGLCVMPFCVLWMNSWKNTSYFALKEKSVLFNIISKLMENDMTIFLMHNGIFCL